MLPEPSEIQIEREKFFNMVKGKSDANAGRWAWVILYTIVVVGGIAAIVGVVSALFVQRPQGDLPRYDGAHVCDDGNACTVDFTFGRKGCVHYNTQNGTSCTSACYKSFPSTDPSYIPTWCTNGVCTGSVCSGTCVLATDCPAVNGTGNLQVTCLNGGCLYSAGYAQNINSTQVATVTSANSPTSLYVKQCNSFINANNTWVNCLDTTVNVFRGNTTLSNFDQVTCQWTFSCNTRF